VWRQYNDHRVNIVEEKQVLEDANGGGLTKSAYYVIYISEKELQDTKPIEQSKYEPSLANFENLHPYGRITSANIMKKIQEDNRKLMNEVDEYKGSETAKRVTN